MGVRLFIAKTELYTIAEMTFDIKIATSSIKRALRPILSLTNSVSEVGGVRASEPYLYVGRHLSLANYIHQM